ncbi:MAG: porin [Saprospiraceae bacterium]
MKKILVLPFLLLFFAAFGQTSDSTASLIFGGFADVFYQYDFNQPADNARPGFLYNHNRHNEANVNLAFVKGAYAARNVRSNLALMVGTYADDNLSAETDVTQHIYEANVGLRLGKGTWLDAGILPSHIGFESAHTPSCRVLTRSLVAENSPYFETGVRLTYQPNDAWTLAALYLNGWQRVARPAGISFPAFGTQIVWKPSSEVTLNYSTYLGSEKPDTNRLIRQYHNVYGIFVSGDWEFTAGFDFGAEQIRKGASDLNTWYTPVLIARYQTSPRTALALRGEYFEDEAGVIVATGTPNGFKTLGLSLNFDYKVSDNALWRIEGRLLSSEDEIFVTDDALSKNRPYLTTSLAISF